MKLIINEYLASLKERDELDAILPDLLSELGLLVFSRPARGTRQNGVDVAAVGSLEGGPEKVYLLTIKPGDLTRAAWGGDTPQSPRQSLTEILDAYIPNRIPEEHTDKDIVICLCIGGDIQEQVREQVGGYIRQHTTDKISFEEWNGDKLASLILSNFLREDLFPQGARSQLRKSLALIDEPEASYRHFSNLVRSLSSTEASGDKEMVKALRQINICLWILFAWARDAGNTESAYLSSELALLYGWQIAKPFFAQKTKAAEAIQSTFKSLLDVYQEITSQYLREKILPYTGKRHLLSVAVGASSDLDVNLRLFDVLGRIAMGGIWAYWGATASAEEPPEIIAQMRSTMKSCSAAIKELFSNNPTLLLPIKEDQAIDVTLALLLLGIDPNNRTDIITWLSELVNRAAIAYQIHGKYPCTLTTYSELLEHPHRTEENYRKTVTQGSVLFPMIALWAGLLGSSDLYDEVQTVKLKYLTHCNFQFWYPDEYSEEYFYTNRELHGATLSQACIERSADEFLNQAFAECKQPPHFNSLSAVQAGLWPVVLVACRHYRIPVPLHLLQGFYKPEESNAGLNKAAEEVEKKESDSDLLSKK